MKGVFGAQDWLGHVGSKQNPFGPTNEHFDLCSTSAAQGVTVTWIENLKEKVSCIS